MTAYLWLLELTLFLVSFALTMGFLLIKSLPS